jgi:hypothetical protein
MLLMFREELSTLRGQIIPIRAISMVTENLMLPLVVIISTPQRINTLFVYLLRAHLFGQLLVKLAITAIRAIMTATAKPTIVLITNFQVQPTAFSRYCSVVVVIRSCRFTRPVQGDYDGDGKTDIAIWQATTGQFWVLQSSTGAATVVKWGQSGDFPIAGFNRH